ncbi:MAG: lysophospholipid acyltransferase family protein [Desulfobacteraceae bacterium]|nr:lysophospholipid acyltransferase family protein [Desulfobacteraceae bacterium]
MKKSVRNLFRSRGFVVFLFVFIRFYSLFLRIRIKNEAAWQQHLEEGGSVLLCTFHQQFFPLIRHFKTYRRFNPCIMISRSKDGDIIAPVANLTGWHVARGSSSRGGKDAMEEMIGALENNCVGANIIDGPRGPIGKVKPGAVRMAQRSGAVLVPCVVTPESAWFFNSWDRFFIPKPLSKVTIRFLGEVRVDAAATREEFERTQARLEKIMAPYLCI